MTPGHAQVKMLVAILQPPKVDAVRTALEKLGVDRITIGDARGYARQRGQTATYRGHQYRASLLRKVALEIVIHDDQVDRVLETISNVARTSPHGNIGDGKIFVVPIVESIRIRDGVRGPEAV